MIKINFQEPNSKEWNGWKNNCTAARDALVQGLAKGIMPVFTDLYKAQKEELFSSKNNFYGKCAYCESLVASNQPGDVEHYRPKGRVTDEKNKPVEITKDDGTKIPHPGYYWLAYDHSNLLPSCADCNRPSSGNSGGMLIGKWDQFPVNGNYAIQPGDEATEDPLLINPTIEEPSDHLDINDLGILSYKTTKGETTIKVLGLNQRQALVDERKRIYEAVKNSANLLLIALAMGGDSSNYKSQIDLVKDGSSPYSMAGRKAIADFKKEKKEISDLFN